MKKVLTSVLCLLAVTVAPTIAGSTRIWVLDQNGTTIEVIDPNTNKIVDTIKSVEKPYQAVFSPDARRAYITTEAEKLLNVMDLQTGKIIAKVPLSGGAANLPLITKDGKRVLVCIRHSPEGAVDIIDTASLERVKTLPMKGPMHDIYISPDGKYAVAGSPQGKFATVIDLQKEETAWDLPFDRGVLTMTVEGDADKSPRRIFVSLEDFNGFAVVDFATHKEINRISLPTGNFTVEGKEAEHNPSHGSAIAPDGKTLWVPSRPSNAMFVYSLPDLKLLGNVPLPAVPGKPNFTADPHWITFTPDSKTVYVSTVGIKAISVIDVKAMKRVASIPIVGQNARHVTTLVTP